MANEQLNINLAKSKLKPLFADEIALLVKIKAKKKDNGEVEKEGHISIIFIDITKQQPIGEFVISRTTAKDFIINLNQTIINLDKELASKDMPKPPEIKTTGRDTSYR